MVYTLIINRKSYDLPKRTLGVVEKLDDIGALDANSSLSTRQKYEAILACIVEILGDDNAAQILGGSDIDDIDLSDLILTFRKIVDAYNRPVLEYERGKNSELFEQIEKLGKVEKLAEMVKSDNANA